MRAAGLHRGATGSSRRCGSVCLKEISKFRQSAFKRRMDFLQTCLQLHLATDEAAVHNVPLLVSTLSNRSFESSHTPKWTNRVNALLRARDPGARWAGLVLALHTSRSSRALLISNAQTWITTVLPMLSVSVLCLATKLELTSLEAQRKRASLEVSNQPARLCVSLYDNPYRFSKNRHTSQHSQT